MVAAFARRGGADLSLCLASAGLVKTLSISFFTLVWTHSIEKVEWQEDWRVTPKALELIQASFPVSENTIRQGLCAATWPGRLDVVSEQPLVILDGAHNPQAVETLVAELPALLRGRRVKLLFSVMRDKDWKAMVPLLARVATEVVVTRVPQARAEEPAVLQAAFAPFCPVRVIVSAQEACQQLMAEAGPDEAVVVCGSLFLVAEVYPLFSPTFAPLPQQQVREAGR